MVTVRAFGEPDLLGADGRRLDSLLRHRKRFALLLFLACDEHRMHRRREHLTAVFWPEADEYRARNSLRQALHVIRADLGPGIVTTTGDDDVVIDHDSIRCDARLFLRELAAGRPETALSIYRGEFLEGFDVHHTTEFNLWADRSRARFRSLAVRAAKDLAHTAEGTRSVEDALLWWRRALELDPFDEIVLRRVVTLLAGSGNRCGALAEYERFRRLVAAVLDATPSEQTVALSRLVANAPPDQIPVWVGDRRSAEARNATGRRRRVGDITLP